MVERNFPNSKYLYKGSLVMSNRSSINSMVWPGGSQARTREIVECHVITWKILERSFLLLFTREQNWKFYHVLHEFANHKLSVDLRAKYLRAFAR